MLSRQPRSASEERSRPAIGLAAALLFVSLAGCEAPEEGERTADEPGAAPHTLEITGIHDPETGGHLFELSADEIDSGWTTFRFRNASPDDHFVLLMRLPEDEGQYEDPVTFETWHSQVTVPFQETMYNIVDPEVEGDEAFAPFANLPDWFGDVVSKGGPGFTAPGRTVETTVHLEPGHYIVECYVKDENEDFHSYRGMLEQLTVRETASEAPEPRADVEIRLSSDGIETDGPPAPGSHTVAVHFEDQTTYEHMLGHDVHLVRLNGTDIETVARWMNWMVPGELVSPAPGTFLGGTQTMAAGRTAYFTVDLEPGEYAWISEVPAENEMWETFTVSDPDP